MANSEKQHMSSCAISIFSVAHTEKCKHCSKDLKWAFLKSISDMIPVLLGYDKTLSLHIGLLVLHYNIVTQHHIPEENVPHPHCCEILKTHIKCVTNEPYICLIQSLKSRTKCHFSLVLFRF
jgi:hypothetical protein